MRSKTCRGLSSHWNLAISLTPWLPPDFGLRKTIKGRDPCVGIGLTTNVRVFSGLSDFSASSSSPFLRRPAPRSFFRGDLRRLDLKFSRPGSLTIQEGGTVILQLTPAIQIIQTLLVSHLKLILLQLTHERRVSTLPNPTLRQ